MRSRHAAQAALALALGAGSAPALAQANPEAEVAALVEESSLSTAGAIAEARAQTAAGDLIGAAATLERALLADPNANDARLLYAATLCRLDDRQAAGIEFGKLEGQSVDDALWREADEACGGAFPRPAPSFAASSSGLAGEAYAGIAYDQDALGAIAIQTDYGYNDIERRHGWAGIAGLRLGMRSSRYGAGGGLYGSLALSTKHDVSGPDQDYDIGELRGGYGRDGGDFGYSVGAVARHLRIFNDPYVTEYGAQGEALLGNGAARHVRLKLEAVRQDYGHHGPGHDGDGMHYDASAAIEARVGAKGFATLGTGAEYKDARVDHLGYVAGRLFGLAQLPVGAHGHYINLGLTYRLVDFTEESPLPDRSDKRLFARVAYGLPLVSPLFGEIAASYTRRSTRFDSTTSYPVYFDFATYHSVGGEARLIWKF